MSRAVHISPRAVSSAVHYPLTLWGGQQKTHPEMYLAEVGSFRSIQLTNKKPFCESLISRSPGFGRDGINLSHRFFGQLARDASIFATLNYISDLISRVYVNHALPWLAFSEQRSVAESFCGVAVTVKFYCNCDVAKTFRNGPQVPCDKERKLIDSCGCTYLLWLTLVVGPSLNLNQSLQRPLSKGRVHVCARYN